MVAVGVPPGLGEPVFDKLKADLAKALLSLPAVMAFEYGAGFGVAPARPAWIAAATFLDEYLGVLDARGEVDYAGLVADLEVAGSLMSLPAGERVQRRPSTQ